MDFTNLRHELAEIDRQMLNHAHIHGFRQAVQFEQKRTYTFEELLIIINMIDSAWETHSHHSSTSYRKETQYIQ